MSGADDLSSFRSPESLQGRNDTITYPELDPPGALESPTPDGQFPWPPRAGRSSLDALVQTWKLSVFQPTLFFRTMPVPGPVGPAVLYFLIVGVPAVGLSLFWQMLFQTILSASGYGMVTEPTTIDAWMPVIRFLLSPIFLLIGLFITFIIQHAILAIFGGARRGPGTTLRAISFSYSPALFAVIPFVGAFIGAIWIIVVDIIGLRESHQTDGWRAAIAVLLPFVAIIFLGILLAVFVGVLATYLAA